MTQEIVSVLCETWLQTVLIISITTSLIILLKEKAIGNDNTLRFAMILFAVYAYLCFLIYNQYSSVLYNILSGMVGAMVVFLFKKPNQKDEQKNKPTTT